MRTDRIPEKQVFAWGKSLLIWLFLMSAPPMRAEVRNTIFLIPGIPAEAAAVLNESGSSIDKGARRAAAGGGWTYRVVVPPQTECMLSFEAEGAPAVSVTASDGKVMATRMNKVGAKYILHATVPMNHPLGGELRIQFRARRGPIAARNVESTPRLPDRNGNGLSDTVKSMMGLRAGERATLVPRPDKPHTTFYYAGPYDSAMAVPTDEVTLFFPWGTVSHSTDPMTWADRNYAPQTMIHSRYAWEQRQQVDEVQTDRDGNLRGFWSIMRNGKVIARSGGPVPPNLRDETLKRYGQGTSLSSSYYMVPTQARTELAKQYYVSALAAGATAVGFDEPEFWAATGYSKAFKQEWKARYGTPWQPPDSSVDARYKSEQLKGFLLRRQVETILNDVQQRKPSATRIISLHSPVNYPQWNIVCPHYNLLMIPALQEVIAEVWPGTSRVPAPAVGVLAERTFEVGFLEYSSADNLARGSGKRILFLMDPMEDKPNLLVQEYSRNYKRNLLAALMFPEVDDYAVMVWPQPRSELLHRIYGRVPNDYATLINTVVGALCEMWRYPGGKVQAGSRGIGTFIADSMGWQRADPSPSDFDGFYGLSLPLVLQGVPVEVLSLDRAAEPGYLDAVKTLLISYDFLKPTDASLNRALADWTRQGGTLVFFGGTDAYNAVSESWWRRAGYASPVEDLFAQMGLPIRHARVLSEPGKEVVLQATTSTFDSTLARLRIPVGRVPSEPGPGSVVQPPSSTFPRAYPVTLYTPPSGARPLYRMAGGSAPAVWEASVGKGTAVFVGVAPGYLTTEQGSRWVRALAQYALEKAGGTYREQPYFLVRRGPYTAIRTLDKPYTAQGRFVDLLSPTLAVVENPVVPPKDCAFLADAGRVQGTPHVLAVSGRLRAYYEGLDKTSFLAQAPSQTGGVARLWAGQLRPKGVKAFTVLGAPVPVTSRVEGGTVLLRYPNDADGVVVRAEWEGGETGK